MQAKNKHHFFNYLKSPLYVYVKGSNTWSKGPSKKAFFSTSILRFEEPSPFMPESGSVFQMAKDQRSINRHFVCFAEQKKNEFNRNIEINYFKSIVFDRYTWLLTVGRLYLIMRNLKYYIRELLETQKIDQLTLWLFLPLIINVWQMNEIKKTSSPMMFYLKTNLPGLTESYFSSENSSLIGPIFGSDNPRDSQLCNDQVVFEGSGHFRGQEDSLYGPYGAKEKEVAAKRSERPTKEGYLTNSEEGFYRFSKGSSNLKNADLDISTKSNPISWETFALTDYKYKLLNSLGNLQINSKNLKDIGTESPLHTSFYNTKFVLKTTNIWGNKTFRLYSLIIPSQPVGFLNSNIWPTYPSSKEVAISNHSSHKSKIFCTEPTTGETTPGPIYSLEFHERSLLNKIKFPTYWQTVDHLPKKLESLYSDKLISFFQNKNNFYFEPSTLFRIESPDFTSTSYDPLDPLDSPNLHQARLSGACLGLSPESYSGTNHGSEEPQVLSKKEKTLIQSAEHNSDNIRMEEKNPVTNHRLDNPNGVQEEHFNASSKSLIRFNSSNKSGFHSIKSSLVWLVPIPSITSKPNPACYALDHVVGPQAPSLRKASFLAVSSKQLHFGSKSNVFVQNFLLKKSTNSRVSLNHIQDSLVHGPIPQYKIKDFKGVKGYRGDLLIEDPKQFYDKNFIVLQKKLITFLSKNQTLDASFGSIKADQMLGELWFNSSFRVEPNEQKVDAKNISVQTEIKNGSGKPMIHKHILSQQRNQKKPSINFVNPRLMSGYYNPDKSFSKFNLGSQVFSIEIPSINFSQNVPGLKLGWSSFSEEKGSDGPPVDLLSLRREQIKNNQRTGSIKLGSSFLFQGEGFSQNPLNVATRFSATPKPVPNLKLSYIDTPLNNVFGVYDKVQADFFGGYNNTEGTQETEQTNTKKKGWVNPFRKPKIEGIPQFIRSSKTEDVYLKNQNQLKKSYQLNFSYSNPFKDSLNEGVNRFGKTYSFADLVESPVLGPRSGQTDGATKGSEIHKKQNDSFKLTRDPMDPITLICLPQSRLPIPQLNLNLTEETASYTISKVQLDSLFYSFQIPFRSKIEWSNHFENWKTRLTNWIAAYQGISITDFDEESYCCEFEQLITELIFTRINTSFNEGVMAPAKHKSPLNQFHTVGWSLGPTKVPSQVKNDSFVGPVSTLTDVHKSLSYFDYQNFFYSIITQSSHQNQPIQHFNFSKGWSSSSYGGEGPTLIWPHVKIEDFKGQNKIEQIYQYLPYAEGHMLDYYSPQNQGGVRFGSVSTVYGVSKTDPNMTHQMIYTGEPITLFSIGAIFQFSFFFSNIVFLKYFYKLYGKELIQFILSATGWLKEADENSQQEIGLNELEKALLIVNKPKKRLKNIAGIKSLLPEISLVIWFLRHAPKRIFWGIDYRLNVNLLKFIGLPFWPFKSSILDSGQIFSLASEKRYKEADKDKDKQKEQVQDISLWDGTKKSGNKSDRKDLRTWYASIWGSDPESQTSWSSNQRFDNTLVVGKPEYHSGKKNPMKPYMELQRTSQTPLSLGDIIPKGILLIGPPGTGKTFLVQALAGESEVPALVQSAGFLVSDPQLGLTRLEYLLDQAQKLAPCIVFIDEIDTLGATRELVLNNPISENTIMDLFYNQLNSEKDPLTLHLDNVFDYPQQEGQSNSKNLGLYELGSGNPSEDFGQSSNRVSSAIANQFISESEARKNQLSLLTQFLIEMDGLKAHKQILFIGATNRAAVLDPALTRPGRFDKILKIDLPGKQKRIEILKLYSKNLGTNFSEKKDWTYLANQTVGLSAADLAAIMNQSSIKAILNNISWSEGPTADLLDSKNSYFSPTDKSTLSLQSPFQSSIKYEQRSSYEKSFPIRSKEPFYESSLVWLVYGFFKTKIPSRTSKPYPGDIKTPNQNMDSQEYNAFYGMKNFEKLNNTYKIEDFKDKHSLPKAPLFQPIEKFPIHTLQTIEHGFNTIVNANRRQSIKFKFRADFSKQKITSFKKLA